MVRYKRTDLHKHTVSVQNHCQLSIQRDIESFFYPLFSELLFPDLLKYNVLHFQATVDTRYPPSVYSDLLVWKVSP